MKLDMYQSSSNYAYDVVAFGQLCGLFEFLICLLFLAVFVSVVFYIVRYMQKQQKWIISLYDILLVAGCITVLGLYGLFRIVSLIIDNLNYGIVWLLIYTIVFVLVLIGFAFGCRKLRLKQMQNKNKIKTKSKEYAAYLQRQQEQKQKEQALEALVKPKLKAVKLGNLGVFSTEKDSLGFGYLLARALERHDEADAQISFVLKTVEVWRKQIESHSQYIINYFMFNAIENTYDTDTGFWLDWNIDEKKYPNEKCLEIFHQKYDNIIKNEISEYLAKDTTKDIKELFQKHFPFFAYDKFTAGIMLEYLSYDLDTFSIQMSDENSSVFCGAYEQFNSNLEGIDWHNF